MFAAILAPAFLLLASAAAQVMTVETSVPVSIGSRTSEQGLSILPISTSQSITVPQATTGLDTSITGIMSIPPGETPITTGLTFTGGSTASGSSGASSGGSSPSGTGSAAPSESTGAAPAMLKGDGTSFAFAVALSGLSVTFGFAWTLL